MLFKAIQRAFLLIALLPSALYAEIAVEGAYVRAVAPGQMVSAAFMTLHNPAEEEMTLVSATSDIAEAVELHSHVHKDGVMSMRQVENIAIPAAGSVALQPGGYHIMLIGLTRDLTADQPVAMTLQFADGSQQTLNLPVKKVIDGLKHHQH